MHSFLTAQGTEYRLTPVELPPATDDMGPPASLWVYPDKAFQSMLGFGGAFTEAAVQLQLFFHVIPNHRYFLKPMKVALFLRQ